VFASGRFAAAGLRQVRFLVVDAVRTTVFGLSSTSLVGLLVCGATDALSEEEDTSVVSFRPGLW
jgi:hypothetical protein